MAELEPIPFPDLVRRMRREAETSRSIFDLPVKKWWIPDPELDFSVSHFGRRAATPVGPAAGPHTQLAQNIVLSWLAGGRIIELKTVQIDDRLSIPRPCIHVPNVGYNVEWSQELTVEQSIVEYAKACYLIEILKATRAFGLFPEGSEAGFDTIYDISVGYDLEGIRSEKVTGFIRALQKPQLHFRRLRAQLQQDLEPYRRIKMPRSISDCVTLSTFHGCPADQIEAIARYLLEELGLHTIIKLNPTLLGYDEVRELLHERLGYRHLELDRAAFDVDLQYDDGLAILRRLQPLAEERGSTIGAKFTNTLVVRNDAEIFPTQRDPYMYLSGQPLHVIAMTLMQRFRDDLGFEIPTSFSAGIDAKNFPVAVACGLVPVTVCTDLLRQGGYGRLPAYLRNLGRAMKELETSSRDAYVLSAYGHGGEAMWETFGAVPGADYFQTDRQACENLAALKDPLPFVLRSFAAGRNMPRDVLLIHATRVAGRLNGRDVVRDLADDPRYHAARNAKTPRRVERTLGLYDCINCDLCITACPNDAIFAYRAKPVDVATEVLYGGDGGELERAPGAGFTLGDAHQLAVLEGACNECSNCEVYCPEDGAPFAVKERLFASREAFDREAHLDGFYRDNGTLHARLAGVEMRLKVEIGLNRAAVTGDGLHLELTWEPLEVVKAHVSGQLAGFDTATLWRMKTAWESIYRADVPNPVNPSPR
ncbi:MAG: glutamate synthase [Acidobacteria bacterium]|nr:MAG: glutamate synthase [Acidobacteriota bacterium]